MRKLIVIFSLLLGIYTQQITAQTASKLYIGDVGLWDVMAIHYTPDGELEARYVKLPTKPRWEGFRIYKRGRFVTDVLSIYHEDTGRRSTGIGIVVAEYGVPLMKYIARPEEHYSVFLTALNKDLGTSYEPPSDSGPIEELK